MIKKDKKDKIRQNMIKYGEILKDMVKHDKI